MKTISFLNQEVELNIGGINDEGEVEVQLDHLLNGRQLKVFLTPEEAKRLGNWLIDLTKDKPVIWPVPVVYVKEPEELNFDIPPIPDPTKDDN